MIIKRRGKVSGKETIGGSGANDLVKLPFVFLAHSQSETSNKASYELPTAHSDTEIEAAIDAPDSAVEDTIDPVSVR